MLWSIKEARYRATKWAQKMRGWRKGKMGGESKNSRSFVCLSVLGNGAEGFSRSFLILFVMVLLCIVCEGLIIFVTLYDGSCVQLSIFQGYLSWQFSFFTVNFIKIRCFQWVCPILDGARAMQRGQRSANSLDTQLQRAVPQNQTPELEVCTPRETFSDIKTCQMVQKHTTCTTSLASYFQCSVCGFNWRAEQNSESNPKSEIWKRWGCIGHEVKERESPVPEPRWERQENEPQT